MCDVKDHIVLAEEEPFRISWCKDCKIYSLIIGTSSLTFTKKGLDHFTHVLEALKNQDFCYDHFGISKALLRNNRTYAGIYLSKEEVHSLLAMIKQGIAMNEVYHVLYN